MKTLSEKNKYYINKNRYYELKYFCLQYPIWKKAYLSLDGLEKNSFGINVMTSEYDYSNPTEKIAIAKAAYSKKLDIVESAIIEADEELGEYLLKGITEQKSYDWLLTNMNIPCSRDTYYDRYRRVFYILNKYRE